MSKSIKYIPQQISLARIQDPADKWEYYDTIAFYRWLAVLGTIVAVGMIF